MKQDKQLVGGIVIFVFILLSIAGFVFYMYNQVKSDRINDIVQQKDDIHMVFGLYKNGKLVSSQLLLMNSETGLGGMVDIPGNLYNVSSSLQKSDRLDIVFNPNNPSDYIYEIERYTGISVPFYVFLSMDQLENTVDLLEGIQLFILEGHESELGNIIPSGSVLLDGRKAREYFYLTIKDERDSDRILRHQKFIQQYLITLSENLKSVSNPVFVNEFHKHLTSNLDIDSLLSLMTYFGNFHGERMIVQRIMGSERIVDDQLLLFPYVEGKVLREMIEQIQESIALAINEDENPEKITVEILNGTDQSGLARKTAEILKSLGYEIYQYENAETFDYEKTVIIDRRGNTSQAQEIAKEMRTSNVITEFNSETSNAVDVTVILGKDFDGRYVIE